MNIGRAIGATIGTLAASVTLAYRTLVTKPPRPLHPGQLLLRIAADQRRIWSCPLTIARGNGFGAALGVIGVTAVLIALDPYDTPHLQQPAFQQRPPIRTLNCILSGRNMAWLINTPPLSVFIGGMARRDSWAWQTALLAAEAAANAELIAIALKHADRRMRPIEMTPDGDFNQTWFRTKNRSISGAGGFPSAHTASAFAVATVFAERYRRYPWITPVAYALAGIIGLSRINARAHFPSDVFFGAAMGYSISHFVVLQRETESSGDFCVTAEGHLTAEG